MAEAEDFMWHSLRTRLERVTLMLLALMFQGTVLAPLAAQEPTYQGVPLSEWLSRYRNGPSDVRQQALRAFREMGPIAKPLVPKLVADLRDNVERGESQILVKLGAVAVPELAETLDDERAYRGCVRHLLIAMDSTAVPAIVEAAKSAPPNRRLVLIDVLGQMGKKAQAATLTLRDWLDADDAECKLKSAIALAHIDSQFNRESFPVLLKYAAGSNDLHQHDALYAISIGLEQSMRRMTWGSIEDQGFARLVAQLDPQGKSPAVLLSALDNVLRVVPGKYNLQRDSSGEQLNANQLARQRELLTRFKKEAIPKVAGLMQHSDEQVRGAAIRGVGHFGDAARPWLNELVGILRRRDGFEESALYALESMREAGRDAIGELRALIDHEDDRIRSLALKVLYNLEPDEVRRLAHRGKTRTGQSARQVLRDRNDDYLKKLNKPAGVLAIDVHDGYTGFKNKDNIYRLEADEPVLVNQTRLHFYASGDRGPDTKGKIEVSVDGQKWTLVGRWDPKMMQAAVRNRNWHQLELNSVAADWSTDTLLVRFSYEGGKEQLNIFAVRWEPKRR